MPQPLNLTFAELEFVLLACPPEASTAVREQLRFSPTGSGGAVTDDAGHSDAAAAGLASLLARGLCEVNGGVASAPADVVPGPEITALTAALLSARSYTAAAGWRGEQADRMYVFDSPSVRVAMFPSKYGLYDVRLLDPAEPLSALLGRYLDAHLVPGELSAFVAKSTAAAVSVAATAAVDASGTWSSCDSLDRPDAAARASRKAFHARLVDVFDGALYAVRSTDVAAAANTAAAAAH